MSAVCGNSLAEEELTEGPAVAVNRRRSITLRLFGISNHLTLRAHRLLNAVNAGIWLGLLDRKQIAEVVAESYNEVNLYHSQLYNLGGLFPWEAEVIRDHFGGCRAVVVAAAGGGREMIALARAGVHVDGFDCNPALVEKCREFLTDAEVTGRIILAPPDEVPSGLNDYDGGIVGCGALAHIAGRTNRVKFLKDLKAHLRPGSPLLVSVAHRPQGSKYHLWIYQVARVLRKLRRSADPIELGDHLLDCYTHQFVESELRSEVQEAGLNVVFYSEAGEAHVVARA